MAPHEGAVETAEERNTRVDDIARVCHEARVKAIIDEHGLDFVLRICATAAIEREASYRAVKAFTGKEPR